MLKKLIAGTAVLSALLLPPTTMAADMDWQTFKAGPLATAGMDAATADGVAAAMAAVLGIKGQAVAYSFDQNPASASGFSSAATDPKGFFPKASMSASDCTITFGSAGVNGSASCPVTGETTNFGSPPSTYTINYVTATMAALAAANPAATAVNFNSFVSALFAQLASVPGDGVIVGDVTTGILGTFKISATTGNWSFSGTSGKLDYDAP